MLGILHIRSALSAPPGHLDQSIEDGDDVDRNTRRFYVRRKRVFILEAVSSKMRCDSQKLQKVIIPRGGSRTCFVKLGKVTEGQYGLTFRLSKLTQMDHTAVSDAFRRCANGPFLGFAKPYLLNFDRRVNLNCDHYDPGRQREPVASRL